jgi:hypothetical protein
MIQTPDRTRCLLLKTDGDAVEATLRARLEERNWQVSIQRDPHVAMAEMCLREWSQKTRASWGLKRLEGMVLVIDAPTSRPPLGEELDSLLAAMERYLPATTIWVHSGGELCRLGASGAATAPETKEEPAEQPCRAEEAMPPIRPTPPPLPTSASPVQSISGYGASPGVGVGRLKLAGAMDPSPALSRQREPSPEAENDIGEQADEAMASPEEDALPDEPPNVGDDRDSESEMDESDDRTELTRAEIDMLLGIDDGGRAP